MSETAIQHDDPHEHRDVGLRGTLVFVLVMVALLFLSFTALWFVFGRHDNSFAAAEHLGLSLPGDELEQRDRLAQYKQAQTAELERLAWTDASHQYAKLPIDDAMRLLAAKGDRR